MEGVAGSLSVVTTVVGSKVMVGHDNELECESCEFKRLSRGRILDTERIDSLGIDSLRIDSYSFG